VAFDTSSGCGFVHYCDRDCQVKHWSVHKIPCRTLPIYKANQEVAAEKKTLVEQEQALGVDHEKTLRTVYYIANLLKAQGKLDLAEPFILRALEGQERTLGCDHIDTLTSVVNLGALLQAQGKLNLAEPFLRRALEGRERTLGRDQPDSLTSLESLRNLLEAMEKGK
jgi:tetratricopeptide (TPR) repeat protein